MLFLFYVVVLHRDSVMRFNQMLDDFDKAKDELKRLQDVLNSITTNSKTENRKQYLNFLWACYSALPGTYVHDDPNKCNFPDPHTFDGQSLLYCLGRVIADFISGDTCNPIVWEERVQKSIEVMLPDAEGMF